MSNQKPLVTIMCAAFNQKDYIAKCIEGFVSQKTNFPVEIIIHDDASTDGTQDVIKQYAKQYPNLIRPIFQEKNQYSQGISIWNKFIYPMATGKYYAECEGDDYWIDPNKLQRQVDFLESHPDYILSTENAYIYYTKTGVVTDFSEEEEHDVSLEDLLIRRRFPTASVVYRCDAIHDFLKTNLPTFDTCVWAYFATKGKIHFNPVKSSIYNRGCGVTENNKIRWAYTSERFNKGINKFFKPSKKVRDARNRILFTDFRNAFRTAKKTHNKKEALHFLRKMVCLSPGTAIKAVAKKIVKKAKTAWVNFRYKNLPVSYGLSKKELQTPIVVSLTSYPARFPTLHISLKSVMNQTMKPSKIILWLDKDVSMDSIPKSILKLQRKGLEIRCEGDSLKPHKKYIHAMKEFRDACIVTVDDDVIYTRDMISSLYASYQKHPTYISARRVHKILYDINNHASNYNSWVYDCKKETRPSMQLLATGVGGVLYPPHVFDMETENFSSKNIMENAWSVDDIWLKFVENSLNIPVIWVPNKQTHPYYITNKELAKTSLYIANVHNSRNDDAIKKCEEFFGKGL